MKIESICGILSNGRIESACSLFTGKRRQKPSPHLTMPLTTPAPDIIESHALLPPHRHHRRFLFHVPSHPNRIQTASSMNVFRKPDVSRIPTQ